MTLRASELIGRRVCDRDGRPVGRIADLMLDAGTPGSLSYALIRLSPVDGDESARLVALPWSLLTTSRIGRAGSEAPLSLQVTRDALQVLRAVSDKGGDRAS
jgi:sporulation protein YlmC with PRC-barrel domain